MRYVFFLLLCACSDQVVFMERPVDDLYNDAMDLFEKNKYAAASKAFAEVERQHPYSQWALKAQLMSAYCSYEAKKYEDAIEAFTLFTQLHPGHKEIDYAYYMLGICYYEQIPLVDRDQTSCEKARKYFDELISRFPDSVYAKDARFKIDLIQDHLAAKDVAVGRYYQNQRNFLAALGRFQYVIKNYPQTSHITEALHRSVECFLSLNLMEEAKATAAVLGHNYPNSPWYADTYALIEKH